MKRKILVGECMQETSSFNPQPTHYEDFVVRFGGDVLDYHRRVRTEVHGAVEVFDSHSDLELLPAYSARFITSGGTVTSTAFNRILGEFVAAVRHAGVPNGVYLCLHGAMVAENEDDTEARLIEEARKIVGENVPIVASFDLHGILSDRILRASDAIVVYHTYPHVDFVQTGQRAARLLLKLMNREVRPVTARVSIPALVRGDELITETGLFGHSIRYAQRVENGPAGLSAAMFIGNPFTDVPDLCSNAVVVTDGAPEVAEREAIQMASGFWTVREHLHSNLTSLEESIRIAVGPNGHVVLVDAADATSSGAPGDSNAILRALIDSRSSRTALLPIVDTPAVQAAFATGVGGSIRVALGGTVDRRFQPVTVDARVKLLSDGLFPSESDGSTYNSGNTAVFEIGPIRVVASSRPVHLFNRSLFLAHGQDPARFDIVVVKSPHCEPRFFQDHADRMINVDAPGATSANLPSLGHTRCARPIFPLDRNVEFIPRATLFQRNLA
jgi:microcystin degradation protein MlrC